MTHDCMEISLDSDNCSSKVSFCIVFTRVYISVQQDALSGSNVLPCVKIDKPVKVYLQLRKLENFSLKRLIGIRNGLEEMITG